MPKISVIVPFFNCENHIAACIDSLTKQTYPRTDYEIIFIDNNSTDASAAIVAQHIGILRLSETKQGSYAARNRGIRVALGDILAFTDPDCVSGPEWLQEIAAGFESGETQVLLGYRHYANPSLILSLLAAYEAEKAAFVLSHAIPELYYGYTNNMAVRREVFNRVGLFRERTRGSDTVFVQQAVEAYGCSAVNFCREMQIHHLEVDRVSEYYKKRLIYGQSNEFIHQAFAYRPLGNGERWQIFLQTLRAYRYSVKHSVILLGLLIPGALYYELGRRRGAAVSPHLSQEPALRPAPSALQDKCSVPSPTLPSYRGD